MYVFILSVIFFFFFNNLNVIRQYDIRLILRTCTCNICIHIQDIRLQVSKNWKNHSTSQNNNKVANKTLIFRVETSKEIKNFIIKIYWEKKENLAIKATFCFIVSSMILEMVEITIDLVTSIFFSMYKCVCLEIASTICLVLVRESSRISEKDD